LDESALLHSLSVKCLQDKKIGPKIIIQDDENNNGANDKLSLPGLNCGDKDPYFVGKITDPRHLYAAISVLPISSSIEIRNKSCDGLAKWSLEPIKVTM